MNVRDSFHAFVLEQTDRKDGVGDLARFVAARDDWPKPGATPREIEIILTDLDAPIEVVRGARPLCDEYQKTLQ